jgi:HK97 family phage major capsid protein
MSKLTKLLEYGFAGDAERTRMLNKESFKTIVGKDTHTLLQSEKTAIDDSTLVQEEVYKTVIEGTEPVKCMREVVPIFNTDSYSIRFVKGETGAYATKVAEGAKIEIDTQYYTKQDITIDKYGVRPLITNELIEDALFDVVELELKKAGAKLENAVNRQCLYQMLQGTYKFATSTLSPAGAHIAISDIAQAVGKVKKQDFLPDTLVLHPTAEAYLLQDSNLAYVSYAGGPGALRQGNVGNTIMGLKPYTCTATDSATPIWDDTTAASDVTAMVFSKKDFAALCMRRDLTIEQYDDPIHDLIGISLTMRFGTDVLNEKAGCCLFHK